MLLLFFTASSSVFAQNAPKCTEYKVSQAPVQCGPGYTGMKVPITTYTCPSKNPVLSYDTTGCVPVGTLPKNPLATNCSVTPGDAECMPLPKPSGCPAGKHWTTQGSGVAHCVGDDINCPFGTSLAHDFLGNPVCNPNTCPGNQVLQADGKSCACPSGTSWNGSSCIAIPQFCPAAKVQMKACPAGMTGKIIITTTYNLPDCAIDKKEDFSQCKNAECPEPSTSYSACPAGQTGSIATTTSYVGQSCAAVTNINNSCKQLPPQCPTDTVQAIACPVGFSGVASLKTTYDQNNQCARMDTIDNSGCIKAQKNPTRIIDFARSVPELGIIGSNDLCYPGIGTLQLTTEISYDSASPTISRGRCDDVMGWVGFTFVPITPDNNIWYAANAYNVAGREVIKSVYEGYIQTGDPQYLSVYSSSWYNRLMIDLRESFLQTPAQNTVIIRGNGLLVDLINPLQAYAYTTIVRKGDVIGTFLRCIDDDCNYYAQTPIYAPSDGYLLNGAWPPRGWGSAN
ncbi:hypothetical protein [Flavobacterium sp.]|uniref:hypothetical protein n=1 Tax=Flavobacterium sp. TaxID=239 RepID=UPI00260BCE77|nr:hypothetical protein [Flavobacterium sp.]